MNLEHKDIQKFLPFGEQLRGFANQKFLTPPTLNGILKERGIFVLNDDKDFSVPLLQTLLLSPREFDKIRDAFATREDNKKTISRDIQWGKDTQLYSSDVLDIDVSEFITKCLPTCTLERLIKLTQVDENPNHLKAEIAITRKDLNKSWYEQTNIFEGSIEFINDDNGKGRAIITYTAPEIKEIAEYATKEQLKKFKAKGILPQAEELRKIIFKDFTNEDRFVFFFRLTNHLECEYFTCENIKEIAMTPEESILPEEIKWMENLSKIALSGSSLDKKYFIEDRKYHANLILWSIDASYKFAYKGETGICTISFGFPDFKSAKGENAEFEMNIPVLSLKSKVDSKTTNSLKSKLLSEMDRQKSRIYNNFLEYKAERDEQ